MNIFQAWKGKRKKNIEAEMSFFGHLAELRKHLIRIAIALLVFLILSFSYFDTLFHYVILGPKKTSFVTYKFLCWISELFPEVIADLCGISLPINIINIQLAGQFMTQINSSFMIALVLTIPYAIYELWSFVKPGLCESEKKTTSGFTFWAILLFLIGICFGYFIFCPLSVHFLANYSISSEVVNQVTISSYVSTISMLTLASGFIFELPMLVYIFTKLGLLTAKVMSRYRKYAVIGVLFLAAVITPTPDVVTMLAVSFPIYILYEVSVLVAAKQNSKDK